MNDKQFDYCVNGHDKNIVGRDKHNRCKVCVRATGKRHRSKYKEKIIQEKKIDYQLNKNKVLEHKKVYYQNNRDIIFQRIDVYRKTNPEKVAETKLKYHTNRFKEDPIFKLACRLRSRLYQAIKNNHKKGSAVRDLGCTIPELKKYLESKFYSNMTWDNWGSVWELDHIKELHKFDLTDRYQLLEAVHYTNLQPLSIKDHREKTAKDNSNP